MTSCAEYALFYVNAYGGWDQLLIEGNTLETDTLKRYTREVVFNNSDAEEAGVENYVKEITHGNTLHTGWLLSEAGKKMHHLINSPCVYLYEIAANIQYPVMVTLRNCEYRTFRNNGNRLVNYALQVDLARPRIRR